MLQTNKIWTLCTIFYGGNIQTQCPVGRAHIFWSVNGFKWLTMTILSLLFLKKIEGHTCKSFLCGRWCLCFRFLVKSPLGFKARLGSLICTSQRSMLHPLIFTSGATPADLFILLTKHSHKQPYQNYSRTSQSWMLFLQGAQGDKSG